MKSEKSGNIVGAIILISLGVLFSLNNFDIIPWSIWGELWKLWPIALIIPGITLLFQSNDK